MGGFAERTGVAERWVEIISCIFEPNATYSLHAKKRSLHAKKAKGKHRENKLEKPIPTEARFRHRFRSFTMLQMLIVGISPPAWENPRFTQSLEGPNL